MKTLAKGRFLVEAIRPDGTVAARRAVPNRILNQGLDSVASRTWADCFRWMTYGSGSTAEANNQTGLATEIARSNEAVPGVGYCETDFAAGVYRMRRTCIFDPAVADQTVREVGTAWASSGAATHFSRAVLTTPVSLEIAWRLRVIYELQLSLYASAENVEPTIDGWPVSPAATTAGTAMLQRIGLSRVNNDGTSGAWDRRGYLGLEPSWDGAGDYDLEAFCSSVSTAHAALGSSVDRSGGTVRHIELVNDAYVTGSYERTAVADFDYDASQATVRTIGFGVTGPDGDAAEHPCFEVLFEEAQTLEAQYELSVTFKRAWDRL